jgi:hypothetical protein
VPTLQLLLPARMRGLWGFFTTTLEVAGRRTPYVFVNMGVCLTAFMCECIPTERVFEWMTALGVC